MLRGAFAVLLLCAIFVAGCNSSSYSDKNRVPEGAPDTSDPSAVNMGTVAPGVASKAEPGPPGK